MKKKITWTVIAIIMASLLFATQINYSKSVTSNREIYLNEGFEGTFPPTNWTLNPSSGNGAWVQDSGSTHGPGSSYEGNSSAMFNNYNYSANTEGSILTPIVDISSAANPIVKFYWWNNDSSSNPAMLKIYTTTNNIDFTLLDQIPTCQSGEDNWQVYQHNIGSDVVKIKITAISDYGLKNTFIDSFTIEDGPTTPIASLNSDHANFGEVQVGTSYNPFGDSFELTNTGVDTLRILNTTDLANTGFSTNLNSNINLTAGQVHAFGFTFTPETADTSNVDFVISTNGGDVTIHLSGIGFELDENTVQIGNGYEVDKSLPCEPAWQYTYSQSLFRQDEINIADKQIKKIFYKFNGHSSFTDNVTIYMGTTSADTISAWIPLDSLTMVFSGQVTTPNQEGWMEIELDSPFTYNNIDNLIIGYDENSEGMHSYSDDFYCTPSNHKMSIVDYNNNDNVDPANPTASHLVSSRPDIRIEFENIAVVEHGFVAGIVTEAGTNTPIENAVVSSGIVNTQTSADGHYQIELPIGEQTITVSAVNHAEFVSSPVEVQTNETTELNIQLTPVYTILNEGFESGNLPPAGWNQSTQSTNSGWNIWNFTHTGDYAARFYGTSNNTDDWMISPQIHISGQAKLKYWSWLAESGCSVLVSTGSPNPSDNDFVEIENLSDEGMHWILHQIDLSNYDNSDIYIAFRGQNQTTVIDWTIDDIMVTDEFIPGKIEGNISLTGGTGNVQQTTITVNETVVHPDNVGNYSINLSPGTYSVTASLDGYISQTLENIVVTASATTDSVDFSLNPIIHNPPRNLSFEENSNTLKWNTPQLAENQEELIYDDGYPSNAVNGNGTYFGSRLSPTDSCRVLSLKFFTYCESYTMRFDVKVLGWNGNHPTDDILFQSLNVPAAQSNWTEVDLSDYNFRVNGDFVPCLQAWMPVALMEDENQSNNRAWKGFTCDWELQNATYFVRATVQYNDGRIAEIGDKREIIHYNIFLDNMENPIGNVTWEQWKFENLTDGQTYHAGVQAVYSSGVSSIQTLDFIFHTVANNNANQIVTTELIGNYPNPFNPKTTINYSLKKDSHVQIIIYNVLGQKIKTLVNSNQKSGKHSIIWNGKNDNGNNVASSIYFYRMKNGNYSSTKKLMLLK